MSVSSAFDNKMQGGGGGSLVALRMQLQALMFSHMHAGGIVLHSVHAGRQHRQTCAGSLERLCSIRCGVSVAHHEDVTSCSEQNGDNANAESSDRVARATGLQEAHRLDVIMAFTGHAAVANTPQLRQLQNSGRNPPG